MNVRTKIFKETLLFNVTSIFGPLVIFGTVGWFLDKFLDAGKLFLYISIAVSFVVTQLLVVWRFRMYSKAVHNIEKMQKK